MVQSISQLQEKFASRLSQKNNMTIEQLISSSVKKKIKGLDWTIEDIAHNLIRTNPPYRREITYSFFEYAPALMKNKKFSLEDFKPFNHQQKEQVRQMMRHWSEVSGLDIREVPSSGDLRFGQANLGLGAGIGIPQFSAWNSNQHPLIDDAYKFNPNHAPITQNEHLIAEYKKHADSLDTSKLKHLEGTVWVNHIGNGNGKYDVFTYATLVHEIGHALGLSHTGPYCGHVHVEKTRSGHSKSVYKGDLNTISAMSYGYFRDHKAVTPMPADHYAMQLKYGFTTEKTSDNLYDFHDLQDESIICIKDNGGTDTFDLSEQYSSCKVDLRPCHLSRIGYTGYVALTAGTLIENVLTPIDKFSTVVANQANNILVSQGDDRFVFLGRVQWGHNIVSNIAKFVEIKLYGSDINQFYLVKDDANLSSAIIKDRNSSHRSITLVDYFKNPEQFILPNGLQGADPKSILDPNNSQYERPHFEDSDLPSFPSELDFISDYSLPNSSSEQQAYYQDNSHWLVW